MPIQRIQHRRGTTAEWTTANPVLASGELGYDVTTKGVKIGDGATDWLSLPWLVNAADAPWFQPETYGAVGDGVADDTTALQDAMDAAYDAGGGTVLLTARYGWTGDLLHRGAITVRGVSVSKLLVTDDEMDRGLVALDATARYRYGQWAGVGVSTDDNPGGIYDLVINGAEVGGVTDGLFIMQCVDGYIGNCRIENSAGNAVLVDGAQNTLFSGGRIDRHAAGAALQFSRIADTGQGAGNVKFDGTYIGTSRWLLRADSDPASIWAHDIIFNMCLFENYTGGNDLVHLRSGAFQFSKCVFTNSNNGLTPPPNGCLILIEQDIHPTIPTQATFDSCYLIGGGVNLDHLLRAVTDEAVPQIGNFIRFYGSTYLTKADYAVGIDGGAHFSSAVTFDGDVFSVNVTDWYDTIGTAWLHNVQLRTATPRRYEMPDDATLTLPDPITTKRVGDDEDRFRASRDGTLRWGDGTDPTIGAGLLTHDVANVRMQMGGSWQVTNALELRGLLAATVSAPSTAVALTGAKTGAPAQLIYFDTDGATADITISGGHVGSVILVELQGTGTNQANWSADFHFNGTPPQPHNGVIDYVLLKQELDGDWHEVCRSYPPVNQVRANRVTTGQETMPRETVDQNNVVTVSGLLELTYFTAYKTELITQIRSYTGNTAAGATPTLCRMGLYSVAANGDLTLIAAHANDTALWAALNTAYTKTLTSSVRVVEGNRYAFGRLIVTAAAAPAWPTQGIAPSLAGVGPRIQGQVAAQADLPASVAAGTVVSGSVRRYGEILP